MYGLLHHVELYVADLDRTRRFWDWLLGELGYACSASWNEGVSWKKGATYLVFVQAEPGWAEAAFHRKRPGLNHLAFHGGSREEVDRLVEKLRARGVPILYEDRHPLAGGPDHYAAFFEDPDRLKVELVAS